MDAEIQRAAEAKRQAVRRALSEDERRHALDADIQRAAEAKTTGGAQSAVGGRAQTRGQVALWAMAGFVVVVIGGVAVVARLG